ncbi:hypothetical protein BC361_26625 [Ensifer sp. LC54]|nr:hypothetical protein BC361_26625 [Ensifer sp. LC54]OCP26827.1 hypothetical protein BC363_15955 [Ensifer sp. LC384]
MSVTRRTKASNYVIVSKILDQARHPLLEHGEVGQQDLFRLGLRDNYGRRDRRRAGRACVAVADGPDATDILIGFGLQAFPLFDERKARRVDASVVHKLFLFVKRHGRSSPQRHEAAGVEQMGYDWDGARWRRMKVARYGTAVALAGLLVAVATQIVTRALSDAKGPFSYE